MNRSTVLDQYILNRIDHYSKEDRIDQLTVVWLSDWSEVAGWDTLTQSVKESIQSEEVPNDLESNKYDEVLYFKHRFDFRGYTNEYLTKQTGHRITEGTPALLEACPCCGYRTLEDLSGFDICTVCWWEEDGSDNDLNDTLLGGPNQGVTLISARINFIRFGLFTADRPDLMDIKDDPHRFARGRFFEINGDYLVEKGTDWKVRL